MLLQLSYYQKLLYSILIRKIENDHKRLDEDKLKKIQAHHSNSEELILFVTASTYKWLNTFKGQFSLSINEIAYYFVYERLKKMVAYMKELEKATNEELNDRIIKEPNAFTAVYGARRSPFRFRTAAFRSKTAVHFS